VVIAIRRTVNNDLVFIVVFVSFPSSTMFPWRLDFTKKKKDGLIVEGTGTGGELLPDVL